MGLRVLAAVAVLVSAVMHLYLWFEGYRDIEVIGPAFLLNAVGGAVIAVLLVTWVHWLPALLTLGFGASTLGAFVVSTTVGLFGVQEQWQGWEVWTAAISEAAAIVLGAVLLARRGATSGGEAEHHAAVRRPHLD
jgi:hypothetical protein